MSQSVNEATSPTVDATDPARDAWLAERRKHVTATDVPKLLGLSRFGGPTSVYLDKMGETAVTEREHMTWGRRLEEAIIAAFAERTGITVGLADPHSLIVCERVPLIACTLDGWVSPSGEPVEAKNIRRMDPARWGDEGTDQIPDEYALQLATQMLCTNTRHAFLPVLFSGQELRVYHVEHDVEVEATIIEAAEEFWTRYVTPRVSPPPDGSDAYTEHLQHHLHKHSDVLIEADDVTREWVEVLRDAREKAAAIAKIQAEAEQNIKEHIGTNAGVIGPGFRITWKAAKPTERVEWEAVARDIAAKAGLSQEQIERIIRINIVERAGSRRFVPTFTEAPNKEESNG